jgi:hypothetical protein
VTRHWTGGGALALGAIAMLAAGFHAGRANARALEPHPTQLAGDYWAQLRPGEKQIYLSGFLAGAAAEQVRAEAAVNGQSADSAAQSGAAIARLRSDRALRFRFGTAVYSAQVDDFYWWKNHGTTPIVDVLIGVNASMLKQQTQERP